MKRLKAEGQVGPQIRSQGLPYGIVEEQSRLFIAFTIESFSSIHVCSNQVFGGPRVPEGSSADDPVFQEGKWFQDRRFIVQLSGYLIGSPSPNIRACRTDHESSSSAS
jgi:hypothetical protein